MDTGYRDKAILGYSENQGFMFTGTQRDTWIQKYRDTGINNTGIQRHTGL